MPPPSSPGVGEEGKGGHGQEDKSGEFRDLAYECVSGRSMNTREGVEVIGFEMNGVGGGVLQPNLTWGTVMNPRSGRPTCVINQ